LEAGVIRGDRERGLARIRGLREIRHGGEHEAAAGGREQ
jgi:hypothetical protein